MIYGNAIEPLEEVEGSLRVIEAVADGLGTKPTDEKKARHGIWPLEVIIMRDPRNLIPCSCIGKRPKTNFMRS